MPVLSNNSQSNNELNSGNIVNGNLTNTGHIHNISTQNHYICSSRNISNIERCYNDLKEKIKNSQDVSEYIDQINHYLYRYTNITKEDLRTLEQKLIDSGREDYIDEALFYKESASKFIIKFQQNLSIQYIISSILALIKKDFMHFITPLINNNASIYEVNNAIDIHIIKPIEDILSNTDLSLHFNQVTNLLYFLAGNCHICWDKKC
ncbi:ABC-three component system protein [Acinetobacter radioresistens]|uniref:ABC-three component systems C-terminal domain-containing protein n=4 Tax=Acinetobacter TaxID=469 RepID=A0ABM9YM52_ACIRA|nr:MULTISPECIES: ABC-three component system protein [Acinetobacter]HAD80475.1 hypothetical protein [Flavobacteriaceae bacterium]EET82094.1 hypothetical protein ACIRA0001_0888 [Acinetobacter radioresistens SK82]EEY87453.1 hypothetical protein HMPREF0018_00200 [Acinetobacter radioresistens SH164]EXE54394.1 hypothetical protein J579_3177 [Acinetobacter sp. 1239920]MCK4096573.1 hypothetical protein [Acinetobacter radioresistens]